MPPSPGPRTFRAGRSLPRQPILLIESADLAILRWVSELPGTLHFSVGQKGRHG